MKQDVGRKRFNSFFSIPCRPTKTNGGRTRNLKREHDPKRWDSFKAYNKRDVETEIAIQDETKFPMPDGWDQLPS